MIFYIFTKCEKDTIEIPEFGANPGIGQANLNINVHTSLQREICRSLRN